MWVIFPRSRRKSFRSDLLETGLFPGGGARDDDVKTGYGPILSVRGGGQVLLLFATFCPSRDAQIALEITTLIAHEIVGADGAAEIGPAAGTPIINEASLANETLEALRFAQLGV
jgi:hypothetical protein